MEGRISLSEKEDLVDVDDDVERRTGSENMRSVGGVMCV